MNALVCLYFSSEHLQCVVFSPNQTFVGLQFWVNMKPYTNQPFGPSHLSYTIGISGKNDFIDQKTSLHRLRPGYHTTIHVIPKILETTSDFDNFDLNTRGCKLRHETAGFQLFKEYSRKGCELECAARKATSFCKCLPWQYSNNFTSLPMCDMFGGYCFNEIVSNIIYYKMCKSECLEDCQYTSLSIWQRAFPLNTQEICKDGIYFDLFFKQNFQRLFAFEYYQMLVKKQSFLDLEKSLRNGSLCKIYLNKYVAFVSVESPTKSITKSHKDQRKFFIDKLGTIGGTLSVCAGMSVLSMFEVAMFVCTMLISIAFDATLLWKKIIPYLKKNFPEAKKKPSFLNQMEIKYFERKQETQKLYVSRILLM